MGKDDDDDLFAGLGDSKPQKTSVTPKANNNSFMNSLFGGGGSGSKTTNASPNSGVGGGTSRDFVLDDKYKIPEGATLSVTATKSFSSNMPQQQPRSRRGAPIISSGPTSNMFIT